MRSRYLTLKMTYKRLNNKQNLIKMKLVLNFGIDNCLGRDKNNRLYMLYLHIFRNTCVSWSRLYLSIIYRLNDASERIDAS